MSAARKENTQKKGKRGGLRSTSWKKGQSGNPSGRPKDKESWSAITKAVGDMYPEDLIKFIGMDNDLGRMLAQLPKKVQMKYQVTARVYASLMFEPTAQLWDKLMERAEGKVVQPVEVSNKTILVDLPDEDS
jgi:hypothetical protein